MIIEKIKFFGAGQHTVTRHATQITHPKHKRLEPPERLWDRRSRGQPGNQHPRTDIRRAAYDLYQAVVVTCDVFPNTAVINLGGVQVVGSFDRCALDHPGHYNVLVLGT